MSKFSHFLYGRRAASARRTGGEPPATMSAPSPSSSTRASRRPRSPRQVVTDEVHRVERRIGPAIRARRSRAAPPRTAVAKGTLASTELIARLQRDLRAERAEVLEPLLRRLRDLGQRLSEGVDIPPERIAEGLTLWEEYLTQLHNLHVDQFRLAGPSDEHPEQCALPLIGIEGDPDRGAYRIRAIRAMWGGYNLHIGGYRELLGVMLGGEAQAELAWEGFEEDYAKTCLPTHVTPSVAKAWSAALDQTERESPALRQRVADYLEHTAAFEVAAAQPKPPA